MPTVRKAKTVDELRHAEYYNQQLVFDRLYEKSSKGECFDNLVDIILSRENILLAYRNIKTNTKEQISGVDRMTIKNIGKLSVDEVVNKVRYFVVGSNHGYRPKLIRCKDIPKTNGSVRPIGIPCMWDRLIQQCIKQVLEPICEAKFSTNSYGFRPNRCVEHAVAETHRLLQRSHLNYVIEFDMGEFFKNVNHSKFVKQIWAMGIHDKKLIFVIKRMLKTPIQMSNGSIIYPSKGILQGGLISPLFANIVLNELDKWIESQWQENPIVYKKGIRYNKAGAPIKSNQYGKMRKTNLKEMYIIRYADDFRIFCRTKQQAEKTKVAVMQWLKERLRLDISEEKNRIINVKRNYVEFLGFKLKLIFKGKKWIVKSHVSDKRIAAISNYLKKQIKKLPNAKDKYHATSIIRRYNLVVMKVQNYYHIATHIVNDFRKIQFEINAILNGKLHGTHKRKGKLGRTGRELSDFEKKRYGVSKALRYYKGSGEPIYPIGYVQPSPPISKARRVCAFTVEGRKGLHNNLSINIRILHSLMNSPVRKESLESNDNRLSLYSSQRGKCAVTQRVFQEAAQIQCHHKIPKNLGGSDEYGNLCLVLSDIHKLIHAIKSDTINYYLELINLTSFELTKVNKFRELVGLTPI